MPSSNTAARLYKPEVSRLPVNLSHKTWTTVDWRLLPLLKNSCTCRDMIEWLQQAACFNTIVLFKILRHRNSFSINSSTVTIIQCLRKCFIVEHHTQKNIWVIIEPLTISSRHWIVPRDASTISSERLSTRVWAFILKRIRQMLVLRFCFNHNIVFKINFGRCHL